MNNSKNDKSCSQMHQAWGAGAPLIPVCIGQFISYSQLPLPQCSHWILNVRDVKETHSLPEIGKVCVVLLLLAQSCPTLWD